MNYIIDYTELTIHNAESNGAKPIGGVEYLKGLIHLHYINDDGLIWWQLITEEEAGEIVWEQEKEYPPYTPSELGLGEGLLL